MVFILSQHDAHITYATSCLCRFRANSEREPVLQRAICLAETMLTFCCTNLVLETDFDSLLHFLKFETSPTKSECPSDSGTNMDHHLL